MNMGDYFKIYYKGELLFPKNVAITCPVWGPMQFDIEAYLFPKKDGIFIKKTKVMRY